MENIKTETLELILDRLRSIDPPVKKIAVNPDDPAMTMYFLDLDKVCYVTSRVEFDRAEIMFITVDNEKYYNNMLLIDLEKYLKNHPHFMRSSKSAIINMTKIRGFKYSTSRDLWFEGIEEPVINCVTPTYLEEFEKHFK
jgi:DNA-binding LytR/AlgR family response regulator